MLYLELSIVNSRTNILLKSDAFEYSPQKTQIFSNHDVIAAIIPISLVHQTIYQVKIIISQSRPMPKKPTHPILQSFNYQYLLLNLMNSMLILAEYLKQMYTLVKTNP